MNEYYMKIYYPDYLMHYGVKGMKWGHRKRYYDSSGNLNARGIAKYAKKGYTQDSYNSNKSKLGKAYDKVTGAHKIGGKLMYNMSSNKANKARAEKYLADEKARKEAANTPEAKAARAAKRKKAMKVGAAVAGTALAAYGAYKLNQYVKTKNGEIAAKRGYDQARKLFDGLQESAYRDTTALSSHIRVDTGQHAINAARSARNDNFRTAARNVINYKRSGGDLNMLRKVGDYAGSYQEVKFGRR